MVERDFESLYQRFYNPLRALIYRICGTADLEDLSQDSFLKIWRSWDDFRGEASRTTWAYRIAMNVIYDYLRRSKRAPVYFDPQDLDQISTADLDESKLETQRTLRRLMGELSENSRVVLVLFYFEDLDLQKISDILEIPLGTVKSRLHSAKQELAQLLQREGIHNA